MWSKFHVHIGPGVTRVVDGTRWPEGFSSTATFEHAKSRGYRYVWMDENKSFYLVTLLWTYSMSTIGVEKKWEWQWIVTLIKGKKPMAMKNLHALLYDKNTK